MAVSKRTRVSSGLAVRDKPSRGGLAATGVDAAGVEPPSLPTPEQDFAEQRLERIAARAYDLYQARGGEHGQDVDDWLQAEQQVDAEIGLPNRED
jgi:hypothetical protein